MSEKTKSGRAPVQYFQSRTFPFLSGVAEIVRPLAILAWLSEPGF